jgi:hypothetical protein
MLIPAKPLTRRHGIRTGCHRESVYRELSPTANLIPAFFSLNVSLADGWTEDS